MAEYLNYNNVFLANNTVKLLEYIRINNYIIKLKKNKQLYFGLIYSLESVKLEMLKTYIKINLANSFICFFKFPAKISIFFNEKFNKSFCFYINYQDFNNLMIKN